MPPKTPPAQCPAIDPQEAAAQLALMSSAQLERWKGLPLVYLGTPEGQWHHRFTPQSCALAFLDTGHLEGAFHTFGRSQDMSLRAGSLALFQAEQEVHAMQSGSSNAHRLIVELDASRCPAGLLNELDVPAMQASMSFEDAELAGVMRAILQEVRSDCPSGRLFAESLSLGLLLHLKQTRSKSTTPRHSERGSFSTHQKARLDELIFCELASDLSLATLCKELGMSRTHFMRLFRNSVGTSPHRYVMGKRIERAHALIVEGRDSLTEIALSTGFSSQSHLHRIYREAYGITPGTARRGR